MNMAPRGRPRKTTRSDGAIENMMLMGFQHDDIVRELNKLLKLYGEKGWIFIESDAYKVLIEVLLEAQERGEQPENGQGNGNLPEMEPVIKTAVLEATDAGPSNLHFLPSSSTAMEAISRHRGTGFPENFQAENIGMRGLVIHANPPLSSASSLNNKFSAQRANAPPTRRRRRPCFGWIDSDDDGEPDIIEMIPAFNASQDDTSIERERKRKSGWDVAPDTML